MMWIFALFMASFGLSAYHCMCEHPRKQREVELWTDVLALVVIALITIAVGIQAFGG